MTELEHKAREAWHAVAKPETVLSRAFGGGPMPPAIALDMVQDVCGDRDDAVTAVLLAAASALRERIPDDDHAQNRDHAAHIVGQIPGEYFGHAELWVEDVLNNARRAEEAFMMLTSITDQDFCDYSRAVEWRRWATEANRVIGLCRQLCAAAHPAKETAP